MRDTHPKIEKKFREMLMRRTPQERLKMGFSMYDSSKRFVEQSILWKNSNITPKELRKEIFLRFYQRDLPKKFLSQILSKIS